MRVCFIGTGLNLLSGSSKPIYQLMGVLGEKGIDTVMISDEISDPLFTINSKLETKLHYKKLNIIRLQKNIIYSLLKRDSDLIEPLHYSLQDFDLIVCTDFIFPWLLKKIIFGVMCRWFIWPRIIWILKLDIYFRRAYQVRLIF